MTRYKILATDGPQDERESWYRSARSLIDLRRQLRSIRPTIAYRNVSIYELRGSHYIRIWRVHDGDPKEGFLTTSPDTHDAFIVNGGSF